MYSSEDLESFYFQYQTEALPHGESLQSFCVKNKVPYNIFQKWYRDIRKKVVEVQVDGAPAIGHEEKSRASDQPQPVSPSRDDHHYGLSYRQIGFGQPERDCIDRRRTVFIQDGDRCLLSDLLPVADR